MGYDYKDRNHFVAAEARRRVTETPRQGLLGHLVVEASQLANTAHQRVAHWIGQHRLMPAEVQLAYPSVSATEDSEVA